MSGKKRIRGIVALLTVVAAVYLAYSAHTETVNAGIRSRDIYIPHQAGGFTPIQLTGTPRLLGSMFDSRTPVYGMSIGGMVHQKEINGLSIAGMHAFTRKKSGVSFSLMDVCNESRGLSFCAVGGAERNYGVATGLWNLAEHNTGLQLGFVNEVKPDALIENNLNHKVKPEGFGVQAGVINYSEGRGLQFGLWNTNPNAWLKHFPFINFAF